jgi:hypothetical protein
MHLTAVRWVFAIGAGLAAATTAFAQMGPASLTYADGAVTRVHAGAPAATTIGVSVMGGDQIATASGRAEITFTDGTVVNLDRNAAIIVHDGERFQALRGRISLRTSGAKQYTAETAATKVQVQVGSVIEITANPERTEAFLRVLSGAARLESSWGTQRVTDYHTAQLSGAARAPVVTKTAHSTSDEFERWALARTVLATSTALKGTENGGGVAYFPYYYYGYSYPYPYYPYYSSPSYVPPYYPSGPSYPYYSSSYYSAPYSYYNSYNHYPYSSYRPSYEPVYSWRAPTQLPASTWTRPVPYTPPSPVGGMIRGAAVPKP